ncbi:MAG: four helix bundle protein [bacterium]|nr:four helix bundle protein [bacterium]
MPIIEHCLTVYKKWFEYRNHFPKKSRYTLGDKIDSLFLQTLELLFIASYQTKEDKLRTLRLAIKKLDLLKFFFRISWELKIIDTEKYIIVSEQLQEIGRMLGGWKKGLESKTPPPNAEEKY